MSRIWIEQHFQKRECVRFITSSKDPSRCGCGQTLAGHTPHGNHDLYRAYSVHSRTSSQTSTEEHWNPSRHTAASPTDAFGTIQFQGSGHPLKAQYVRLSYETKPETVLQLFTKEWQLELPKLLITVHGGKANFNLQAKLKKVLSKGLVNAAKTTAAWIFTAGTNTGVMRHVGEALLNERTPCLRGRVVAIGIAPWGIIENRKDLVGKNTVVRYHSISSPKSRLAVLNNHHSYFILVDNGTIGRYGGEIGVRKKLEKYISKQKIYARSEMESCGVPVVCVVVEGGLNTIRTVLEYVTDTPPVPVVVCDGSGRAADLIAFAHKYTQDDETLLESVKEQLLLTVEKTFNLTREQAEQLYLELMRCVRRKDLITVFRMGEGPCQELDQAVLIALLKGHHLAAPDQLRLALTWNRVDIARSEIFVYGQEWLPGALYQAMMDALELNNVDFVKLLLENGVNMQKFLTIPRLEELYNGKHGPTNTLQYLVRDVRKNVTRQTRYTLYDIGLVIERLMGGAYLSSYCRRKFRHLYNNVMRRVVTVSTSPTLCVQHTVSPPTDAMHFSETVFSYPFNELLIWAVLTKRHKMALFMWQSGEETVVKALVACKLYKAMAQEAAQDDMEADIYEEMMTNAREFEKLALELLDYCYCHDDDSTLHLLTYELQNWNKQTCLGLAMAAKHSSFLAHTASQMLVADLWMGGLRTRKNTNLKVILGLLFPPTILTLEFKSKEELKLMPQTAEQHFLNLEERDDDDLSDNKTHTIHEEANALDENFENEAFGNCSQYSYTPMNRIENGKISTYDASPESLPRPKHHPIRLGKRVYQFYGAPITKFWGYTLAYGVFLVLFTYIVLVKMPLQPSWQEAYVIAYLSTLGIEKVREIITSEPMGFSQKLAVWLEKKWNPCDFVAIIFFFTGVSLRLMPSTQDIGRVIYSLNIMYWYIRILDILSVNKHLGPYVTMIGKMVIDMIYFVVLLLVVLMSYGVARQAILNPHEEPSWHLARDIFYLPYFMLYGEVFADSINPHCGDENGPPCQTGRWINPVIMAIYLLVANILLVNLLIAVFNNIFFEVNAVSQQIWKSQRFRVVLDYAQKPVLPPPLIVISHIHQFLKCCVRRWNGKSKTLDHGLKLFLSAHDVDRIHDFEEECVEGYFREQETQVQISTEEQIRNTAERVELMVQKVDDVTQRQKEINTSVKNLQYEISKLDNVLQETASCLPDIQDFIASYIADHSTFQPLDHVGSEDEDEEEDDEDDEAFQPGSDLCAPSVVSLHADKGSDEMAGAEEESESSKECPPAKVSFLDVEIPHHSIVSPFPDSQKSSGSNLLHRRMQKRRQDAPGLMRQVTVAAPEAFGNLIDEPAPGKLAPQSARCLQRGTSIAHLDVQPTHSLYPQRGMKVERSYSCASQARWNRHDPLIRVVPPSPRPRLASTRGEYTSITDELELVAQTQQLLASLSSPSSHNFPPSITLSRQGSAEQQNALIVETEVLHDAEETDYHAMAGLIQRRLHRDSENLTVSLEDLCSGNTDSESDGDGISDGQHTKVSNKTTQPSISPSPSAPDVASKCVLEPSVQSHPPKSISAHSLLSAHSVFRNETSC